MLVKCSSDNNRSSEHAPRRGMVLPFQPLSLAFNHVNYYVDMPSVRVSLLFSQFFIFFLNIVLFEAKIEGKNLVFFLPGNEETWRRRRPPSTAT